MALNLPAAITVTANVQGSQSLSALARQLQSLSASSQVSGRSLDKLYTETQRLGSAAGNTISSIKAQVGALKALRDEAEFGSRKFKILSRDIQELEGKLKRYQATAGSGGGLSRGQALLAGAAGGIAGAAATFAAGAATRAVGGIAEAGMNAESAQVRLKALTDQFGEYNQAQVAAERIAKTLRLSTTEAQEGFANLYASLRPTGITIKELEDAFIGFSAAARNSGASAQETSAAMIQLKQGLASGVLQGEELRSIREQAPLVAQAIAKELGVTIGELKGLASEGKVTTEVVLQALGKLKDTQLGKLNQQFNTGAQAVKDLNIATEKLGITIAKTFGPTAVKLIQAFTRVLERAADLGNGGKDTQAQILAQIRAGREAQQKFGRFGAIFNRDEFNAFVRQRTEAIIEANRQAAAKAREKPPTLTPEQRQIQADAIKEREAGANRQAMEAAKERLADELKIRQDAELKIRDAGQQREEQLREYRLETIKKAKELEQQLNDQRLQIERNIADTRTKLQGVLEDRALEAERARLAAAGLSTAGIEEAQAAKEIFRTYDQQRLENERNATDAQLNLQRQLEQFKITVAEGAGKIQEAYARSVSNILQDAGDKLAAKMQAGAQGAAAILGSAAGGATGGAAGGASISSIADSSLNRNAQAWLTAIRVAEGTSGPNGYRTMFGGGLFSDMSRHPDRVIRSGGYASAAAGAYQFMPDTWRSVGGGAMTPIRQDRAAMALALRRGVDLSTAPFTPANVAKLAPEWASLPTLAGGSYYGQPFRSFRSLQGVFQRSLGGVGSARQLIGAPADAVAGVRAGVDAQGARVNQALNRNRELQDKLIDQQELAAIEQRYKAITGELDQQRLSAADKLRDEKRYSALLAEGIAPETAKLRVELEGIAATEKSRLEGLQTELEARIAQLPVESALRKELEKQVEKIKERLRLQGEQIQKTEGDAEEERKRREAREKEEKRAQELKDLYASIGGTLSQGIIGGIDAAIEAAMTGAGDLEDKLKSIASGVLKEIGMALIKFGLNSLLGGVQFGGASFFRFADGGVMTGAGPVPLKRYAGGGIANGPQMALFGERGPEAYVPLPDGRSIPVKVQQRSDALNRYRPINAAGTMAGDGEAGAAGGAAGAAGGTIDVRYTVERINNVEYVTAEQFQQGLQQAAAQGAQRGEQRAIRSLQQSTSVHSRVGIR